MIEDIEKSAGYIFKDKSLARRALTLKGADEKFNNERLECLGDAVIGFIVAEKFFSQGLDEGGITERKKAVVCDEALGETAKKLGLDKELVKPKGVFNNKKAVPSAYEALAAAIYLDGGMEAAKAFVARTLDFSRSRQDYITLLQEGLQGAGKALPEYSHGEDNGSGDEHDFIVCVTADGKKFSGRGRNTAAAKREAARAAYISLFNS